MEENGITRLARIVFRNVGTVGHVVIMPENVEIYTSIYSHKKMLSGDSGNR